MSIELDQRAFSFWAERHGRWAVEAGDFLIAVGSHSSDLPLSETVTIEAPRLAGPMSRDSIMQEWMSDPTARQLLEREVEQGQPAAVLQQELIEVIATMPMSTLANFSRRVHMINNAPRSSLVMCTSACASSHRTGLNPDPPIGLGVRCPGRLVLWSGGGHAGLAGLAASGVPRVGP